MRHRQIEVRPIPAASAVNWRPLTPSRSSSVSSCHMDQVVPRGGVAVQPPGFSGKGLVPPGSVLYAWFQVVPSQDHDCSCSAAGLEVRGLVPPAPLVVSIPTLLFVLPPDHLLGRNHPPLIYEGGGSPPLHRIKRRQADDRGRTGQDTKGHRRQCIRNHVVRCAWDPCDRSRDNRDNMQLTNTPKETKWYSTSQPSSAVPSSPRA